MFYWFKKVISIKSNILISPISNIYVICIFCCFSLTWYTHIVICFHWKTSSCEELIWTWRNLLNFVLHKWQQHILCSCRNDFNLQNGWVEPLLQVSSLSLHMMKMSARCLPVELFLADLQETSDKLKESEYKFKLTQQCFRVASGGAEGLKWRTSK